MQLVAGRHLGRRQLGVVDDWKWNWLKRADNTGGVSARALAQLIGANQPCVVLTGAGVSTESGIPDFRSATGIWQRFDPYEVASIDAFGTLYGPAANVAETEVTAGDDEQYAPPSATNLAETLTRRPSRVAPWRIHIRKGCRWTWPKNDSSRP